MRVLGLVGGLVFFSMLTLALFQITQQAAAPVVATAVAVAVLGSILLMRRKNS